MDQIQLTAHQRTSGQAPKINKTGIIPAILYGHNIENVAVAVNQNEFEKVLRRAGESTIIELDVEGQPHSVLIHEVQHHYLTGKPIHADFYEVKMTERLKATVALEFIGESKAVKQLGGTLVKVIDSVEVECLPGDLPHSFVVDVSQMDTFSATITVGDLKISDKVEVLTPGEELVVKVQPPRDVEAELAKTIGEVSEVEGIVKEEPEAGAEGASAPTAEKIAKPEKGKAEKEKSDKK